MCSHILDVVIPSDSVSHTKEVIYASSCPHLSPLTVHVLCTRPQTLSVYTSACAHRAIYDYTLQHVWPTRHNYRCVLIYVSISLSNWSGQGQVCNMTSGFAIVKKNCLCAVQEVYNSQQPGKNITSDLILNSWHMSIMSWQITDYCPVLKSTIQFSLSKIKLK